MRRLFGRKHNALKARSERSSRKSSYKSSDNEDNNSDKEKGTHLFDAFVQFCFFSRAASLSGATYLVTMVSVCMYVCMDGCMLDNCLTEKSITYSQYTKEFFLTADLA